MNEIELKVNLVMELYQRMEQTFAFYQKKLGLGCLPGCGACCLSPNIECTILEVLPIALELYLKNEDQKVYDQCSSSICYFYKRLSFDGKKGHCTNYYFRPAICRMFGVYARKNKRSQPELAACKEIKQSSFTNWQLASLETEEMENILITKWSNELAGIDFHLSQKLYPINTAFQKAIEYINLHFSFRPKPIGPSRPKAV